LAEEIKFDARCSIFLFHRGNPNANQRCETSRKKSLNINMDEKRGAAVRNAGTH